MDCLTETKLTKVVWRKESAREEEIKESRAWEPRNKREHGPLFRVSTPGHNLQSRVWSLQDRRHAIIDHHWLRYIVGL